MHRKYPVVITDMKCCFSFILISLLAGYCSAKTMGEDVNKASSITVLPALSDMFPGLRDFEGKASIYEYDSFPDIQHHHYLYPDPEKWVAGLKIDSTCDSATGHVRVWNENGKIRFIWVTEPYPDGGRFFAFRGDTIDAATPINSGGQLFMSEVGIVKWRYIYNEGLLSKIAYYRTNIIDSIWAVDSIEYWSGSDVPRYIYRYQAGDSLNVSFDEWDTRTVHDLEGKIIRKDNRKGEILWKKITR